LLQYRIALSYIAVLYVMNIVRVGCANSRNQFAGCCLHVHGSDTSYSLWKWKTGIVATDRRRIWQSKQYYLLYVLYV